jgi:hypothetical protein
VTNWRDIGDTSVDAFRAALAGSLLADESDTIYAAGKPHTRLLVAQGIIESQLGKSALAIHKHNWLGQRPRGEDGFKTFASFAECAQFWHDKQVDPDYAYADTVTLEDYVHVYAPAGDGNDEQGYVARIEEIVATLPTEGVPVPDLNLEPGIIPMPTTISDIIDVTLRDQSLRCRGYDNLGPRPATPKFLVLHRSINGPGQSNSGYFHETCCPALTDLEVIAATGQGRRFVALPGNISGWANGVVSAPYGDALKWLNLHNFDLNTVNRDGEACEITGTYNDPVSNAAWNWLAQWIASRAHDYGIHWDTFPLIPTEDNRSFVCWHTEFTAGTGKICPGPVVMNYTPTLFERARAIMKAAQTTGTPPVKPPVHKPYAAPVKELLDQIAADLKRGYPTDFTWKGLVIFGVTREYETVKATKRLQYPDPSAPTVGPVIPVRTSFVANYWLTAADAKGTKRAYVITPFGSVVVATALSPRISVRKA